MTDRCIVARFTQLGLPRAITRILLGSLAALTCACAAEFRGDIGTTGRATTALPVVPDAQKRQQMLDILEAFVAHAETYWRPSDLNEPDTGRYEATGSGVTQPRGAGNIAFAYATLLFAYPDRDTIGDVARELLIDHTIQSIRHEALTNRLSGAGYDRWGNGTWQASLETYGWAFAAYLLWDELDAATRALVRQIVVGEATILIDKPLASNEEGDTGAEDNAWNVPTPALAAVMFPDDANADDWRTAAIRLALNASSTAADESDATLIDGHPLSDWMASVNLHPDLTLENHGFFNPIYQQVVHVSIGDAAIIYGVAGQAQPEAFSFRTQAIWDEILSRLATDDGDLLMPAGQDWTSKDYQHLGYLSILATRFFRDAPSVYQARALELVAQRQAAVGTGSMLGQSSIGYETMLVKRIAAAWWNHHLFGPSPDPTADEFDAARADAQGVHVYPYSDFLVAQLERTIATISWDSARPMALLIPRADGHLDDAVFTYYAEHSLMGSVSGRVGAHTCDCEERRFSSAGTLGDRRFSMTAFTDGTTILLDRGEGSTFTYTLESIAGVTGQRTIWSADGPAMGSLSGDWLNAADRLGMIVRGGAGMAATTSPGTIELTGSVGTGSGQRAALLLPLVDHQQTQALEPFARQWPTPDDWSALSGCAADGSLRLAIARWGGAAGTTLSIDDERGAPVPEQRATIESDTATFDIYLDTLASQGQTMRYFVDAGGTLTAKQESEDVVALHNAADSENSISVTYAPANGSSHTVGRTLVAGEKVRARMVGGEATLAGPELEPLLHGQSALESLLHGCVHHGLGELRRDVRAALRLIEGALAEARAETPDTRHAARLVTLALDRLSEIVRRYHLRACERVAIEQARQALEEAQALAYGVMSWIAAMGRVQPGEPLTLRITFYNRGSDTAHHGTLSLVPPPDWMGWTESTEAFEELAPGETAVLHITVTAPTTATPGAAADIQAQTTYFVRERIHHHGRTPRCFDSERQSLGSVRVTIEPLFSLSVLTHELPLAPGGYNEGHIGLSNWTTRSLEILLTATPPPGALVGEPHTVVVPALSTVVALLPITGVGLTTGSGSMTVVASIDTGVQAEGNAVLRFSDDLALNPVGAPWPQISAISSQPAYPPTLASDGSDSTFWVSGGTVSGEGPTPTNPHWLTVDFGAQVGFGSVTMVPRPGYGPTAYTIEISEDGTSWLTVASEPSVANRTQTTTFEDALAGRYLRLVITGSWDWQQPPRNVQIASLRVRPPEPGDLAANTTGAPYPLGFASSSQASYPASRAFDADAGTLRMIRLRITGSWDWVQPPRNVQIVSMRVHSP